MSIRRGQHNPKQLSRVKALHLSKRTLALLVYVLLLLLQLLNPQVIYAKTFVSPSTLTIDGTFTDWGTTGSPTSGVYLVQDYSNIKPPDGTGFAGKASDLNYLWTAISTQSGGTTPASPSNLIQNVYYRIDTLHDQAITGQSYFIQLNPGTASVGYADHLLQIWVDNAATPTVTLVLHSYQTPYPAMRPKSETVESFLLTLFLA